MIGDIIGTLAAVCTTVAFIPQAFKIIKTRQTQDLSLWMYLIFTTGVGLWLSYGVIENLFPVIAANLITFVLAATILGYKIKYK